MFHGLLMGSAKPTDCTWLTALAPSPIMRFRSLHKRLSIILLPSVVTSIIRENWSQILLELALTDMPSTQCETISHRAYCESGPIAYHARKQVHHGKGSQPCNQTAAYCHQNLERRDFAAQVKRGLHGTSSRRLCTWLDVHNLNCGSVAV
jgi:hypothetical protein